MEERDVDRVMSEIRALLFKWDAIGVADEPGCADEYDCLIGPLAGHLRDGANVVFLREWIARERVQHFGLNPDLGADADLAAALVAWRERRGHP